MRRKNPVPPSTRVKKRMASKLYADFTGHDASEEFKVEKPVIPDVMAVIGDVTAICYRTIRDGKVEDYIHEFHVDAQPLFCVAPDGSSIHLIGGEYDFTERGIVDRTDPEQQE